MWDEFFKYLVAFAFTVVSAATTTIVLPALARWLKSKSDSEVIKSGIDDLAQTTGTCVDYLEQTVVTELKAQNKWNSETQKEVLNMAIEHVITGLTNATKNTLEAGNIHATVERYIEAYIQSKKKQ